MDKSGFLTVEEVAQNLKVTRQTVSKYINSKELNAVKINKSYRITATDFENFIISNSTAQEPSISYMKRTKNCTLEYADKGDVLPLRYIKAFPVENDEIRIRFEPQEWQGIDLKGINYTII